MTKHQMSANIFIAISFHKPDELLVSSLWFLVTAYPMKRTPNSKVSNIFISKLLLWAGFNSRVQLSGAEFSGELARPKVYEIMAIKMF